MPSTARANRLESPWPGCASWPAGSAALLTPVTACGKGCSHCCHIPVMVTESEAQLIGYALRLKPRKAQRSPILEERRYGYGMPCTFLGADGRCSIHEHRPIGCRLQLNVDADELLCRLIEGATVPVPLLDVAEFKLALSAAVPGRHGRRHPGMVPYPGSKALSCWCPAVGTKPPFSSRCICGPARNDERRPAVLGAGTWQQLHGQKSARPIHARRAEVREERYAFKIEMDEAAPRVTFVAKPSPAKPVALCATSKGRGRRRRKRLGTTFARQGNGPQLATMVTEGAAACL